MANGLAMRILPVGWSIGLPILAVMSVCFLGVSRLSATSSWDGKTQAEYVVTVETEKPDALYKKGEDVTFKITLEQNKQPVPEGKVYWKISKDNADPVQTGTADIKDGVATVTGKLDEPGFLRCDVNFASPSQGNLTAAAAAGIDVTEIRPALPVPDDFVAFWEGKKKELAALPMDPKMTEVPAPADRPGTRVFDVQIACTGGAPVSGYYSMPTDARPKSAPALLIVDGAGVRNSDFLGPIRYAQKGFIAMTINAHGIPNGKPKEFYSALDSGELKDYRVRGRDNRDTFYFVGMYLRVLRALQFLQAQPEWDGHTLMIMGGSQGGGQAIAGAALEPKVTYTFAAIPGLCDFAGATAGRIGGWPKPIPKGPDGKPDPIVVEATRYADGANMATMIKSPIHFYIGFVDLITPPTCEYAAYNVIPGPKSVENRPSNGHGHDDPKFWSMVSETLVNKAKEQQGGAAATP